ncbi:MAG: AfsR/SARP family transcriptional regulator [Actinomycetota bacterium]|nr:AfsR/SARP family transcriptional regulator [Actinomycetota bacterium]
MLEFRVLGPLEVVGEAGALRLGGPRQRATLAILLLQANRVVPVERLAEELYAGRPPVSAVTQVQRQISELRRVLGGADAIETRPPGYVLHLRDDDFDLARFELLTAKAERARAREDVEGTAGLLREALDLWRGPPLADLAYESFSRAAVERLEELRLAALEARIEADLALGRHAALAAELEGLVAEHPLRERLRGQQMLALYRSGRQAEALEVYRLTRQALVESFGIEPSTPLQALERAILTQDPALDPGGTPVARPARTVLVAPSRDQGLEALVELGAALPVQLVVARLVLYERELTGAATAVGLHRSHARTAAFTSDNPAADLVRLASANDADLVLVDAPPGLDAAQLPPPLAALLERSPAHVGVLSGNRPDPARGVYVPFGGGAHDWAALELGAWLASATGAPLRLVGTRADARSGRRDASRLLADASLAVQRVADVDAAPVLADPDGLVDAVAEAGLVAVGISPRWRHEGIGVARRTLVRAAWPAVLLVHRGPRPGGLAPRESRTRFTWTLGA